MSYFKTKMHQIRFRLGLRPRPRWGAQNAPPDLLAGFKGVLLLTKGYGEGMEKGKGKGRQKGEGREEWGGGGRVCHGFVGWTPLGLEFQIKSPKFSGRFATNRGRYVEERDRREGKEGMRGGRKYKILRRGREVSKHGTDYSLQCAYLVPPIHETGPGGITIVIECIG